MNTLIVGTGKLGQRFYHHLKNEGENPITLSRSEKEWSDNHIQFNLLKAGVELPELPKLDQVFIIVAPDERTEVAYRQTYIHAVARLIDELHKQQDSFHCTFVSSTSVYGGNLESVIDESTDPKPASFSGKVLLDAEKALLKLHAHTSIIRASGLYSKQRQKLIDNLLDEEKYLDPKCFNLIHEDDLCRWLSYASEREVDMAIASDGHPFTRKQLQDFVKTGRYDALSLDKKYQSALLKRMRLSYPSIFDWAREKLDVS
ncbi:sugar nucleotide-binding protein [Kangiella shandongensis]|uniref:sugar nucleotide-binding protein n=1 Tax=Kangiella shandongensis TaxID=2763258 RepID=UPI001CBED309|nr:sugar nucleotide-binding protein [Kangiella shandongensis]